MFIIDVIPLVNLPLSQPQILSYFFRSNLEKGFVVEIPLGRRNVLGVVVNSVSVSSRKAVIKKAAFSLKSINKIICSKQIVPPLFLLSANFISKYYFCPLSLSLKAILPQKLKSLIKYSGKLDQEKEYFSLPAISRVSVKKNKINFTENFYKVIEEIKANIKEQKQVLILVPTIFFEKYYFSELSSKIAEPIFTCSSTLKTIEFNRLWYDIILNKARIIIGRRSSPFLPWKNLGLIVVIDGNNPSYKSWDQKPYYNSVTFIHYLALLYNATITYYQNY